MHSQFSVVTIVKNRTHQLTNLIANLEGASQPPAELIIVWMAPPSDKSLMQSEVFNIQHRFVTSEELPIPQARNKGFASASCERVIHLDVDCLCHPQLFEAMMKYWQDDTILTDNVIPVRLMEDGDTFEHLASTPELHVTTSGKSNMHINRFQSSVFGLSKQAFEDIGGFDEQYHGFGIGDIDFATRCHAAGIKLRRLDISTFIQHRANYDFPINHLLDIVTNANLFKRKWGYFPATEWLGEFVARGYVNADFETQGLAIRRMPSEDEIYAALHGAHEAKSDTRSENPRSRNNTLADNDGVGSVEPINSPERVNSPESDVPGAQRNENTTQQDTQFLTA